MKLTVLRIVTVTTTVNCCRCFEYDVMKKKSYSHFILLVPPFWQIQRLDYQNFSSPFFRSFYKTKFIQIYTNLQKYFVLIIYFIYKGYEALCCQAWA